MALRNFVDRETVIYADWLNGVDRKLNGTSGDSGSLAAPTGAGGVGAEDGASGTLWTTVQEYITLIYPRVRHMRGIVGAAAGLADNAVAVQAALSDPGLAGGMLYIDREYILETGVTLALDNVTLFGPGKLKAKDGTTFAYVLTASGLSNLTILDIEIDANRANRTGAVNTLSCLTISGNTDCTLHNLTVRGALGLGTSPSVTSSVAINASGGNQRLRAVINVYDCGIDANTRPSDGIFVRGDYCLVSGYAEGVTDHAFVLEGCSYSGITNISGKDCTSYAAISNDQDADDMEGNYIDGVSVETNYVGSVGGIVGVEALGNSDLIGSRVKNVYVKVKATAGGAGPIIEVRGEIGIKTGRVVGCVIESPIIDSGTSVGVAVQGIKVDSSDNVEIISPIINMDTSVGSSAIRAASDSTVRVRGGKITGADFGIVGLNDAIVKNTGTEFSGQATQEISVANNARVFSDIFQSWTPVFSSDIGNAAATFSVVPTVGNAKINRVGDKATAIVDWAGGTLNAVTPAYIDITLPLGWSPVAGTQFSPACIFNAAYETGIVQPITGTDKLRFFRANVALFSSGVQPEGHVSISFDIT